MYLITATVKQFIRNVRASKTIADERAVVQKESAAIRASFREESGDSNVRYSIAIWSKGSLLMMVAGGIMLLNCSIFSHSGNAHILAR